MTGEHDKRQRGTREETTEAILDAAEVLFAERGYSAVTVREIAAAAGVSHALVHRYLGSKEQVYRAVLRRNESTVLDAAGGEVDLTKATRLMLREAVLRQQVYLRLVAHSALHGLSYRRTSGRFVATERLVELAERAVAADPTTASGVAGPRFVIASLVAMLLGWSAARDWLFPAAGIEGMTEEEFLVALEDVMVRLERAYFAPDGPPVTD
jgi:AcrR family transcriptional regulator